MLDGIDFIHYVCIFGIQVEQVGILNLRCPVTTRASDDLREG